jgi:hypothetical protein
MASFFYRNRTFHTATVGFCWLVCFLLLATPKVFAQVDQGTITGVVQDNTGAVIPGAQVKLTDTDTGLVLQAKANGDGIYVFSPIKIGNYSVSATEPGFETTSQENLRLDIQERLNVVLTLKPGGASETVTVTTAPPLLQSQEGSVGQVISTQSINDTPLNGRNWVYIAQLTAGVTSPLGGTRGSGTGDFIANGQSAEQNDFVLDGVDNNSNIPDFMNGASYLQRPPPDALAEFKIQTSSYSAEFGHSAGAVVNASIKSGTNQIHGDLWEYLRNTALDAKDWDAVTIAPYHENQFGATLGFPLLKNKLFYFGDAEANRIAIASTNTYTVPTPLMRQGNFSELLNTSLTGEADPVYLYIPNSGGNTDKTGLNSTVNRQVCNGVANVLCANQISTAAQGILNLYPAEAGPNVGLTYNNLVENLPSHNNTWQWDQRMDWNISPKDQAYARYSYNHQQGQTAPPLGPILDGSGYGTYENTFLAENGMVSETHIFNPTFTNEFRFGYNWGDFKFIQPNANTNVAANLGVWAIPFTPGFGGLPSVTVTGITSWGTNGYETMTKTQNVYQILDNVTKILGNHSLKLGVALENIRFGATLGGTKHGAFTYSGTSTSSPAASIPSGSGVADFLADEVHTTSITNTDDVDDQESYNAAYVQDDWRVTSRLALNLGLRYDYYQPFKEMAGEQANFVVTGPLGIGTGSAVYQIPSQAQNVPIAAGFTSLLAANNVTTQYVSNNRLLTTQRTGLAPRVAFAYQTNSKTVINGGFGIFYGGLQNEGGGNLGVNYPFTLSASIPAPSCSAGNCPSLGTLDGVTLETGLSAQLANGLDNFFSSPSFHATDPHVKEPYTEDYNLAVQQAFSNSLVATLSYVGNVSRHIELYGAPNTAPVLLAHGQSTTKDQPFPGLGGVGQISYSGVGTYNSLQAKMEKHYSNGLSFLGTYTWAHALDDSSDAGGLQTAIGYRQEAIIPVIDELTNSAYDVRHRFTFNGNYQLPFGRDRAHLNHSRLADLAVGGWSTSLTFTAQTGVPFTVTPNNSGPAGGTARAIQLRNPFAPGGSPDPTNPTITCASSTRNKTNWYNPCAFANPPAATAITAPVTDIATAITYLGGRSNTIHGPGYNRVNMSLFKNFITMREEYLQFRADAFNLFNHPSFANPSLTGINSTGGGITAPQTFQNNTPDARFFQLALKYVF